MTRITSPKQSRVWYNFHHLKMFFTCQVYRLTPFFCWLRTFELICIIYLWSFPLFSTFPSFHLMNWLFNDWLWSTWFAFGPKGPRRSTSTWPGSIQFKFNRTDHRNFVCAAFNVPNLSLTCKKRIFTGKAVNGAGGYSSSELHLDRVGAAGSNRQPSAPGAQWVLGGSEVNLSSINRWAVYCSNLPLYGRKFWWFLKFSLIQSYLNGLNFL